MPFGRVEFTALPDDHVQPYRGIIRTNWLQGLEALLDSLPDSALPGKANLQAELDRQAAIAAQRQAERQQAGSGRRQPRPKASRDRGG